VLLKVLPLQNRAAIISAFDFLVLAFLSMLGLLLIDDLFVAAVVVALNFAVGAF
jgi:hypothetical protein